VIWDPTCQGCDSSVSVETGSPNWYPSDSGFSPGASDDGGYIPPSTEGDGTGGTGPDLDAERGRIDFINSLTWWERAPLRDSDGWPLSGGPIFSYTPASQLRDANGGAEGAAPGEPSYRDAPTYVGAIGPFMQPAAAGPPAATIAAAELEALAAEGAGAGLADLATFRAQLGLAEGEGTLARLTAGGRDFYGINAHGQELAIRVNAISATHAEADAFNQALQAGVRGGEGTLFVDRGLCLACGQNGAVRSMAQQLGLDSIKVTTPNGMTVWRF
jgi:hypothetical protein